MALLNQRESWASLWTTSLTLPQTLRGRCCYPDLTEGETGSARSQDWGGLKASTLGTLCLVQIPTSALTSCVTLGKVLDPPVP